MWKQIVRLYNATYVLHAWIHATCEGLSDEIIEMYDNIMVLGSQIKQCSILLHVALIIV